MKIFTVYDGKVGRFFPTQHLAEAYLRDKGGALGEEEIDELSDLALELYREFPGAYPRPPFRAAVENTLARYRDLPKGERAQLLVVGALALADLEKGEALTEDEWIDVARFLFQRVRRATSSGVMS